MRIDFFPLPLLIGLGVLMLLLPVIWLWKRSPRFLAVFGIFWMYMLLLTGLTLFPVHSPLTGESRRSVEEILGRVNLTPLFLAHSYNLTRFLRTEMFANVLLTIPFGLLLPALLRVRPWAVIFIAFGIGVVIEVTQLFLSLFAGMTIRVTDITDVLMNAAGFLIGYLLNRLFARLFSRPSKGAG